MLILKLLLCSQTPLCPLPLRLGMLWEGSWRKPSCTTGTTWICRTWWITSRKRLPGRFHFAGVHLIIAPHIIRVITTCGLQNMSLRPGKPQCSGGLRAICHVGEARIFHEGLHVTYSSCTLWVPRFDITPPSAHPGTLVNLGFPMGEAQAGRVYSEEQDHVNVSKYTPVLCSLP